VAALTAKSALEGVRKQASVADLAQRSLRAPPNQIFAWKKPLPEQVAWAFDGAADRDAEANWDRENENPLAKITQVIVERDL
jgi:transposase